MGGAAGGVNLAHEALGDVSAGLLKSVSDAVYHAFDVREVIVCPGGVGVEGLLVEANVRDARSSSI